MCISDVPRWCWCCCLGISVWVPSEGRGQGPLERIHWRPLELCAHRCSVTLAYSGDASVFCRGIPRQRQNLLNRPQMGFFGKWSTSLVALYKLPFPFRQILETSVSFQTSDREGRAGQGHQQALGWMHWCRAGGNWMVASFYHWEGVTWFLATRTCQWTILDYIESVFFPFPFESLLLHQWEKSQVGVNLSLTPNTC